MTGYRCLVLELGFDADTDADTDAVSFVTHGSDLRRVLRSAIRPGGSGSDVSIVEEKRQDSLSCSLVRYIVGGRGVA